MPDPLCDQVVAKMGGGGSLVKITTTTTKICVFTNFDNNLDGQAYQKPELVSSLFISIRPQITPRLPRQLLRVSNAFASLPQSFVCYFPIFST